MRGGCCGAWWEWLFAGVPRPLVRPVALTLGPPLDLPVGANEMARGRGDALLWEGVLAVMGVVGAVREPPLRVGLRERGRVVV